MRIFTYAIRIFLDAYRDTARVIKHFDLIKLNGFFIIPKLYMIRLIYTISLFRNLIKINIRSNETFDNYFENKNILSEKLTKSIDEDGCTNTFKLKNNFILDITNEIFENKDLEYKKNKLLDKNILIKKNNENLREYFDRLNAKNISRVTGFIDLNKNSKVKTFLTSKPMVSLVKNYLNTEKFSISAQFFISTPVKTNDQEKYGNAQFFHWDNDFSKFLKLYIYLTDVDDDSGPHIYIPKTHKNKKLKTILPRLYDDNLIYDLYKTKKKYKGKIGSIFFTDGYGIHKGEIPNKNPRIIINVHFGRNKILYSDKDIYYNSLIS